ncbi:MAG: hypothetical protein R2932_33510 [Caldilineaceae bacterium]
MSNAAIVPVSVLGSQQIMANLRQWRRTPITLTIGPVFGPLVLPTAEKGAARRQAMDALADEMMMHIATLMPPENRGYYAERPGNGGVKM